MSKKQKANLFQQLQLGFSSSLEDKPDVNNKKYFVNSMEEVTSMKLVKAFLRTFEVCKAYVESLKRNFCDQIAG